MLILKGGRLNRPKRLPPYPPSYSGFPNPPLNPGPPNPGPLSPGPLSPGPPNPGPICASTREE